MKGGPKPIDHAVRMQQAEQIAEQLKRHYGERLLALGIYGSLGRGIDGPYSDIEMLCLLRGEGLDFTLEWSAGDWKAEVDCLSQDVVMRNAKQLDAEWSITHGEFTGILALHDPDGIFPLLQEAALEHEPQDFRQPMEQLIVEDIYELVGKLRNAYFMNNPGIMPLFLSELVRYGACLAGLANQYIYTSTSRILSESLSLPGNPTGYGDLCQLCTSGQLSDAQEIITYVDAFWNGVETWSAEKGLHIERSLDELLQAAGQ